MGRDPESPGKRGVRGLSIWMNAVSDSWDQTSGSDVILRTNDSMTLSGGETAALRKRLGRDMVRDIG